MSEQDWTKKGPKVPWEPQEQLQPHQIPDDPGDGFQRPWSIQGRGNGHYDLIAANGVYISHIYCWKMQDYKDLAVKVDKINGQSQGDPE